ncbi:D-2-hydroxyacid dehydrogenase [Sphingobium sp. SCG-1]|nr:D-2-hydroxyacid dehydrogenase [Sphingobium sp. SCG-1]
MSPLKVVAPARVRAIVEPRLPDGVDVQWFSDSAQAIAMARDAEVAWLDQFSLSDRVEAILAAEKLKWLSTIIAGLDALPLEALAERKVRLTNGSGLNSETVADYAVMGALTLAKGFPDVVRAQDRREWLEVAPGRLEMDGTRALIIGFGTIGRMIAARLTPFGVEVTGVRRTADPTSGILGPDDWRPRLADYDWIVLAAPATGDTRAVLSEAEFAAMKPGARVINIARGDLIDQPALIRALNGNRIAGAFLDVTTPEPLHINDPLWTAPNCIITMHLAGRSQTTMLTKGAARFVDNLHRYTKEEPLLHEVDPAKGY